MKVQLEKEKFERDFRPIEMAIQVFKGVEGFDVYNCSQPFLWDNKTYIFGRIEQRFEWMRSWVRLFEKTGKDEWTLVKDSMIYQLEDPYISIINGEVIFGGTHVKIKQQELDTYYGYFYKGTDLKNMYYFTTGPEYMKDIRLVQLKDGKIGVFSRPRSEEITAKYGSESMVGFAVINAIDELNDEVIENAKLIDGLFSDGEWGGCNQAYLLEDGMIGVLGHVSYTENENQQAVYSNMSFVFDPESFGVSDYHLIGTRSSYPEAPAKKNNLKDCAFTSGMVPREDGKVDLYSGIGDVAEGRTVISYPFVGHGKIIEKRYYI